jgi:hypothetical protein
VRDGGAFEYTMLRRMFEPIREKRMGKQEDGEN